MRPFFEHVLLSGLFLASSWPLPDLFWPLPGLFWPLPGLFSPVPGLFWPLPGLFWPKSPKFRRSQRRHFLFIKHCISNIFRQILDSWPFGASPGLFQASSGPVLASSWPLLGLFLAFSWTLQNLQNSGPPKTSFSVHKTLRFEQFFAKFWIPGLAVPFFEYFLLFRASSGPLLASSWPLLASFRASSGLFLASSGLFLSCSGLFLAFS